MDSEHKDATDVHDGEQFRMPTAGPSPELRANIISWHLWLWVYSLVKTGNKRPLQAEDLYDLNPKETTGYSEKQWKGAIGRNQRGNNGRGLPVWTLLFSSLGREYFLASLYKPVWLALVLLQVYVLKALVTSAEKDRHLQWWWGTLLVVAMLVTSTGMSITQHSCFTRSQKVGMKVRSIMALAVFEKVLAMKSVALAESSSGQMLNLVTNDTQKVLDAAMYFHFVWFSVVEIVVVAGFCIWEAGVSAIPGVVLGLLTLPLQVWMARAVGSLRSKAVKLTDARVRMVAEILTGIRVVKYNGWTSAFLQQVEDLRKAELHWIRRTAFLRSCTSAIKDSVTPFATLATFGTYVALHHGNLNPSKAFTILALFSVLVRTYSIAPTGVQVFGEALISMSRLQSLLDLPNGNSDEETMERLKKVYGPAVAPKEAVAAVGCNFSWNVSDIPVKSFSKDRSGSGSLRRSGRRISSSFRGSMSLRIADEDAVDLQLQRSLSDAAGKYILNNVNMKVEKGDLVAIVGPVGSGKSSLLLALLGEMRTLSGVHYTDGRVAYVPQQPWIFNGTVKDNILFGHQYNDERYRRVLFACALEHDLTQFEAGDRTEIGERGINLSGGQKARISLARACYSDVNIVFLDDPLAAVDVPTAKHLMVHVLGGVLKGRTVILVTHNRTSLQYCNRLYLMENGQLRSMTKEDILRHSAAQGMTETTDEDQTAQTTEADEAELQEETDAGPDETGEQVGQRNPQAKTDHDSADAEGRTRDGDEKPSNKKGGKGAITVDEDRVQGVVGWSNFVAYVRGGGRGLWAMVVIGFGLAQSVRVMVDYWLSAWVDRKYGLNTKVYIITYAVFATGALCLSLCRALLFTEAAIRAAKQMHSDMAEKVFRSPQLFFDQNPVGRIVNRFSKDQALVDELLPFTAFTTAENLVGCLGSLAIIAVLIPWFIFVMPPFIIGFFFLQRRYMVVSRELKRLDGVSRSPMYEHIAQTLAGVTSMRAYGVGSRAHTRFIALVDANHRPYILFVHAGRWLGIRLDALAAMCVTVAALLVVLLRHKLGPGTAGVVLVQALQLTGFFQYGVRMAAETENYFTSVERIQTYANLSTEADPHTPPGVIPEAWPSTGAIEFSDYTMAYREDLPPVLNNLSFSVQPMKKVGILGRTGAGKSSLAAALFRMVENKACSGTILVDGIDIKSVGLDDLRQRLSMIPQDPVLFRGTVRINLDPFNQHADEDINEAIRKVHLKKKIQSLDSMVESNGENFSVGQRQLLCLARALLRKSRIIVMDEATAAVDGETDQLIQTTMREVFRDCTVLTIAHRIETVIDSDLLLVLAKGGRIAEFDSPANLLRKASDTEEPGVFANMVLQSGKLIAAQLMQAAERGRPEPSQS